MLIPVGTDSKNILTINAGSSSIKLAVFSVGANLDSCNQILEASISGIGQDEAALTTKAANYSRQTETISKVDHLSAINLLMGRLGSNIDFKNVTAIGHRIVQGGPKHYKSEVINETVITDLEELVSIDPEHLPFAIKIIQGFNQHLPNAVQIACFDTAFFNELPRNAQLLPIASKYRQDGLRRYGFHGLSYSFLQAEFGKIAGQDALNGRVIYAHLGSGVSLAATKEGKPIDTTMSFTPASGIMMSTRSGDVDPGIAWYLHNKYELSPQEINSTLNFESGLLGISDLSPNMYILLQNEDTNQQAADAVNLFVYQATKSIGALTATLNGLDSLVFSGGIGAQAPKIRQRICEKLEFLGVNLNTNANENQEFLISLPESRVGVHIIATNEEQVIANEVLDILKKGAA